MSKIQLTDTIQDIVIKMAEGNPGAMTCMFQMMQKTDWFGNVDAIMMILQLDSMEIYGSKLYMLWSDCCGKDLTRMELVLRNWQMGRLPLAIIKENLAQGWGQPFENLVSLDEMFTRPV